MSSDVYQHLYVFFGEMAIQILKISQLGYLYCWVLKMFHVFWSDTWFEDIFLIMYIVFQVLGGVFRNT